MNSIITTEYMLNYLQEYGELNNSNSLVCSVGNNLNYKLSVSSWLLIYTSLTNLNFLLKL